MPQSDTACIHYLGTVIEVASKPLIMDDDVANDPPATDCHFLRAKSTHTSQLHGKRPLACPAEQTPRKRSIEQGQPISTTGISYSDQDRHSRRRPLFLAV